MHNLPQLWALRPHLQAPSSRLSLTTSQQRCSDRHKQTLNGDLQGSNINLWLVINIDTAGFMLWLVLTPSANFIDNWLNKFG